MIPYPSFITALSSKIHLIQSGLLGCILLLLYACTPSNSAQFEYRASLIVFGTQVDILILAPPQQAQQAQAAIHAVEQQFQHMHQQWHAWEAGGIVHKINQAIAQQQPIIVPESIKAFIQTSQKLTQKSQKLFDPGIGQLIKLWGFHAETWQGPPPSHSDIQIWLQQRPSLLDLSFNGTTLISQNPNVQLDFGGNAKGLAIEMALKQLQHSGIQNALVSIGGDMKAIGSKQGTPWNIGIQSPKQPNQVLARLTLYSGESVVTSGTYQRYFEWQGQRFSHILNPNTGYPANSFASVTVIHPNAITADAAATAILIAGTEQWRHIAQNLGIHYVLAIDQNGNLFHTEAMAQRLSLL